MNIFLIYDIVYVRSVYQKLCSGNDRSSTIEFFFLFFCVPNKNSRELGDLHFLPFLTCWWPAFVQFTWKQNSISFIFILFPYYMTLVERKNSYCASSSKTTNQALNTSSELGSYVAAQPFLCNKTQFNLLSTNNMMDFSAKCGGLSSLFHVLLSALHSEKKVWANSSKVITLEHRWRSFRLLHTLYKPGKILVAVLWSVTLRWRSISVFAKFFPTKCFQRGHLKPWLLDQFIISCLFVHWSFGFFLFCYNWPGIWRDRGDMLQLLFCLSHEFLSAASPKAAVFRPMHHFLFVRLLELWFIFILFCLAKYFKKTSSMLDCKILHLILEGPFIFLLRANRKKNWGSILQGSKSFEIMRCM